MEPIVLLKRAEVFEFAANARCTQGAVRISCVFAMDDNPYETDLLLRQYLIFHYAEDGDQFPFPFGGRDGLDFPRRCVSEGIDYEAFPKNAELRALDLGCSVGGASFELAKRCASVAGIDYSALFIAAANRLKLDGRHPLPAGGVDDEGFPEEVRVDEAIDRSRVQFERGDAQVLREDLGSFDIVIACNLICRLPDPIQLLERLPRLLRPGGQLLITTPYSWLDAYTSVEKRLGTGGEASFAGLRRALEPALHLEKVWDLPFLIREHTRKFQYVVAQASGWRAPGI